FHSNGGSSVPPLTVDKNESIDEPENVTSPETELREGLYLEGWYKEPAYTHKWDFATDKVTADMHLYARWFPKLSTTEWRRIGPNGIGITYIPHDGTPDALAKGQFHQGMAIDPNNTDVLYQTVGAHADGSKGIMNGIIKSSDRGATWEWLYEMTVLNVEGRMPVNIRVDPNNSDRLYLVEMINVKYGFMRSDDRGKTWYQPAGYAAFKSANNLGNNLYHLALDPNNSQHLLISSKDPWNGWETNGWCGIESKDGGDTWKGIKSPDPAGIDGGYGINIWFLSDPANNQSIDGQRWLLATQEIGGGNAGKKGYYLTTDGGETWTHVAGPDSSVYSKNVSMCHGGGGVYYDADGVLYVAATSDWDYPVPSGQILRSEDNGDTWTSFNSGFKNGDCMLYVIGYNGYLYASPQNPSGGSDFYRTGIGSADWKRIPTNNNGWDNGNPPPWNEPPYDNEMIGGTFEFVVDHANKILYASCADSGLYALQLE
ncbi:MAG: InlB B-repeat-containing protein, partial [Treponema sp.]|nr:InlB B-repeat-containing protein [Treponema sp.]